MPTKNCGQWPATIVPEQQPQNVPIAPIVQVQNITTPPPAWAGPAATSDLRFDSPQTLFWFASLARASYSPTAALFTAVARAVVPSTAQIVFTPNGPGLTPGWGAVVLPDCVVVVVSGTTNLNQWLVQIFLNGLTNCDHRLPPLEDSARAMAIYNSSANTIAAALPTSAAGKPTICIGHSMGGAVAQLIWRRRRARGAPGGRCLTFGSPKPGSAELLSGAGGDWRFNLRLALVGDPVPALPPDLGLATLLVPATIRPFSASWDQYQTFGALRSVGANGELNESNEPGSVELTGAFLAGAVAGSINPGGAHVMAAYARALRGAFVHYDSADCRRWSSPPALEEADGQMNGSGL